MKKAFYFFSLLIGFSGVAQSVNDYKYAILPAKFSAFNEKDEFGLNTLTKTSLEKYGFVVFFDTDNLPATVVKDKCNALYVNAKIEKTANGTKVNVFFQDCTDSNLFTSNDGKSKSKDEMTAYNEAFKMALKSLTELDYHFNGAEATSESMIVKTIKDETAVNQQIIPISDSKNAQPMPFKSIPLAGKLVAQTIENGYQLVDNTQKVIFKILKTSTKDVYTASKDQLQGTFVLKYNSWFFEYYNNGKLVSELYEVKF